MCHRRLHFYKSSGCGHLTFTGENNIDCQSWDCFLSASHNCGSTSGNICRCRRYYTQPERIVDQEVPGKCPRCR
ncbi:hypothetical protein SCP_0406250 [Sparassis crispa]|uniref:Uncharacterized protein n=1 Tax=Sparassis crispa TaxID=139825 RepID=A0A401GJA6_9APHY|nr:hypothetical protein SCP_0406250 [Sparassis crispa]GBE82241.1 hypothetical protein SCP_0406250 [Sparassis crispa]